MRNYRSPATSDPLNRGIQPSQAFKIQTFGKLSDHVPTNNKRHKAYCGVLEAVVSSMAALNPIFVLLSRIACFSTPVHSTRRVGRNRSITFANVGYALLKHRDRTEPLSVTRRILDSSGIESTVTDWPEGVADSRRNENVSVTAARCRLTKEGPAAVIRPSSVPQEGTDCRHHGEEMFLSDYKT